MNKKRKIIIFIVIVLVFIIFSNTVNAAINPDADGGFLTDTIKKAISFLGEKAVNASFAALSTLFTALAIALFLLMDLMFVSGVSGGSLAFPFPDKLIFNRLPMFDPNFTNPDNLSITYKIKEIILSVYDSLQAVALSVFAIAAMIVGIKLAITIIATEKAKYKEAITKWLTGIVLLFALKYIIAGAFYINEQVVNSLSVSASEIRFDIVAYKERPIFGSLLKILVEKIQDVTPFENFGTIDGYAGLVIQAILRGLVGNIYFSILAFTIMGQSIAIIISYFKRLFYCLLLRYDCPDSFSSRYNK